MQHPAIKGALSSKTIWFSLALLTLGALQQAHWADWLPKEYAGIIVSGIGLAVMWLRSITNTAVTLTPPTTDAKPGEGAG